MTRLPFWGALLVVAAGVSLSAQMRTDFLGVTPVPPTSNALFDDRVVQEIRLSVNTANWQTLKDRYLEDTYYPADLKWREMTVRNVGIRSRGTGSRSGTKPGLKVDFSQYIKGQTFVGLKSVILRNNTQDPSNLHERVSLLLFRRMGLPASREAHARLYVNDEYAGLYTVVEPVDKIFLSRVYGDNGGYLFEYDYPADMPAYYFEYRGSDPALYVPLPFKPQTHEDDPHPETIARMIRTIAEASPGTFRAAIGEYLDLPAFVRHVAVENFIADTDGMLGDWGMNNFYMYARGSGTPFNLIPWDKSEAYKGGVDYGIFHNIVDVPDGMRNRLMVRVLSYSDLHDLYLDSLLECTRLSAEPAPADNRGWLEREVRSEYLQIREAALADPVKPYTNEQFEADIQSLQAFARERGTVVTRAVSDARAARLAALRARRWR